MGKKEKIADGNQKGEKDEKGPFIEVGGKPLRNRSVSQWKQLIGLPRAQMALVDRVFERAFAQSAQNHSHLFVIGAVLSSKMGFPQKDTEQSSDEKDSLPLF
jgi:hypothetical protein